MATKKRLKTYGTEVSLGLISAVTNAVLDEVKGFPGAIATIFPKTEVRLCVVHQIRNSLRYLGSRHTKEFLKDLKTGYKAPSLDEAESNLKILGKK